MGSHAEQEIVARFVRAYESADLDALVGLLTGDVFLSMPPYPLEYEGRDAVASFWALIFRGGRRFNLVPSRANRQPAFGVYVQSASGIYQALGVVCVSLSGDRICALNFFEQRTFPWFDLLLSLPSSAPNRAVAQ